MGTHCASLVPSRGYKPHVVAELLNVGPETVRYWRTRLDPNSAKTHFSGGRLLAYRVIKTLVRNRFVPVEVLEHCPLETLFEACEHVALAALGRCWVLVDPPLCKLELSEVIPTLDPDSLDALVQPLAGVVKAHRLALEQLGRATPNPTRESLAIPRQIAGRYMEGTK